MDKLDPRLIVPDPLNLREQIDFAHVEDLAEQMRSHGFRPQYAISVRKVPAANWHKNYAQSSRKHEPDWVRSVRPDSVAKTGDVYQVVDGEHRLHAARLANLPAVYVHVEQLDDRAALGLQIAGNTGKSWSQRELMLLLKKLRQNGESYEGAKKLLGKNSTWMDARWDATQLPDEVLKHVGNGLSVEALKGLTAIYSLAGKSKHVKTEDDARRIVLDIIRQWEKAEKPAGLINKLAGQWLVEAQQFQLLGGSPVPTDAELTEKQAADALSRFKGNATELVAGVKAAYETWRRLYPDADAKDFFKAAGASSSTRISGLLDELGLVESTARETACQLCAAADAASVPEICKLCSLQPANLQPDNLKPETKECSMARKKNARRAKRNRDGTFKKGRRGRKAKAGKARKARVKKPYRVIRIAKGAKLVREPGVIRLYRA